jgi:hypothetical protein
LILELTPAGCLHKTAASDHLKKIFDMVGITHFAPIHDTAEDALQKMTADPK